MLLSTHMLQEVEHTADRIIVLDDGRMVGAGTHAELLESNETYREIVQSQLGVDA